MAKVYSWEVSKSPKKYAYIVHPNDYNKAYVGTELKGENLEKVKEWASNCTDSEYKAQFQKMTELCSSKGYNVTFETVAAYLDVDASCDNLRGPSGRGIKYIKQYGNPDPITGETTYGIFYDDDINDENPDFFTIKNGRDGKDGIDGKPGAPGDSGVSSKFIMVYTSGKDEYGNLFTPSRPEGGSYNFDTNETKYPVGWAPNDTEITPPVWMSSRTFTTTEASTDKQWSLPVQLTGENGAPGVDGTSTEFIFCLVPEKPSVEGLPSPNESGYVPPASTGWTPSPTGVDEDNTTEWASIRRFNTNTKIWGPWEEAYIWSKYGVNGQDGDGVQYIFLKNRGELPENPTPSDFAINDLYQNKDNEWVPESNKSYINIYGDVVKFEPIEKVEEGSGITPAGVWTDNPSDVTSQFHSQWVSMRKYRKNSDGKMSWDKYSDPALWGRFGQDGRNATSIRKLFALSTSTSNPPTLPGDSVITGDWGTGFPIDYEAGKNVVWATEAEIWAHNFEFVMSYKLASSRDENGNVIPPADATEVNTFDTTYLPEEEIIGFKYIRYDKDYYEWSGGWCKPYIVTGLKGDDAAPIDYTTSVFGYGYKDYPPSQPNGTHIDTPGVSTDALGNVIEWTDFPNTSGNKIDGVVDDQNRERRWYQCIGHVEGSGKIKKWGDVAPLNPQDGEGGNGTYVEFRFAVTSTTDKPFLNIYDEFGAIAREPVYKENDVRMGWFATDEELPDIPAGGAMWQIWATIDPVENEVRVVNGKSWCGPKRVSGEKGDQGIQGPAGMRGVTGIPGAKSLQMYCLGTYGKNETSESYWDTGDGYFGSTNWDKGLTPDELKTDEKSWFSSTEMPYSDIINATTDNEFNFFVSQYENRGRVIRYIRQYNTSEGGSNFQKTTHQYYVINRNNTAKELTEELPDNEEFNVYVWCIQGNEVWQAGVVNKYVDITTYDEDGNVIKPSDADETNTFESSGVPEEKNELFKYLYCTSNNKYYEWRGIDGDKVEHKLVKIEWGTPFKLQGTNGLRGLTGSRGQVVYPMGVYNNEEVYITTEDKAPYVYDPNDGMFYVYNIADQPWVGLLPENFQSVMIHPSDAESSFNPVDTDPTQIRTEDKEYKYLLYEGKFYIWNEPTSRYSLASRYKYCIDGIWLTKDDDQQGDTPSNNYANAINSNQSPAWVRFESFQALYTSIGIIENGMIGSAVYNNEFMFSQQGIDAEKKPTNYAVVSGRDTTYGFLSAYVYDEKGEEVNGKPTGRHWKYLNTEKYIDENKVNPYEKDSKGNYIHTFMPNVCINFATGQMWLCTGAIQFGINGEKNVPTNDDVATITNRLNLWANDGYLSPVERQSLINEYNSIKAEYAGIIKQAKELELEEETEYKKYTEAYDAADRTFKYYTETAKPESGTDCIKIETSGTYDYNNIINYYPKRQALLDKINKTINEGIASLRVGLNDIEAKVGNENIENGIVINSQFARLFSKKVLGDETGTKTLEAYVETAIEDGVSKVEISADKIFVNGETYINGQFKIGTDGGLTVKDANIENCTVTDVTVNGSMRSPFVLDNNDGTVDSVKHDNIVCHIVDNSANVLQSAKLYPYSLQWDKTQNGRVMRIANGLWEDNTGAVEASKGFVKLVAPGAKTITFKNTSSDDLAWYSTTYTSSTLPSGITKYQGFRSTRMVDLASVQSWIDYTATITIPPKVKNYTFYTKRVVDTIDFDVQYPDIDNPTGSGTGTGRPNPDEVIKPTPIPGFDVDELKITLPNGKIKYISDSDTWTAIDVIIPDQDEGATISISHKRRGNSTCNTSYAHIVLPDLITTGCFYEDGIAKNTILLSREIVELTGYGTEEEFYGWVVTNRTDIMPERKYGRNLKVIAAGFLRWTGSNGSLKMSAVLHSPYASYDSNGVIQDLTLTRKTEGKYLIEFKPDSSNNKKFDWKTVFKDADTYVMATGYGKIVTVKNDVGTWGINPCKATVLSNSYTGNPGFEVWLSDDTTPNDGGFNFMVFNTSDMFGQLMGS